MLKLIDNMNYI